MGLKLQCLLHVQSLDVATELWHAELVEEDIGAGSSRGATGARAPPPPPRFFKRGHRGAPCYEEMYLDLSITSDDNAMLSESDGQNYQSGGEAFVGLGGAPIV